MFVHLHQGISMVDYIRIPAAFRNDDIEAEGGPTCLYSFQTSHVICNQQHVEDNYLLSQLQHMQVVLQACKDQDHAVLCNLLSHPPVLLLTVSRRPAQLARAHSSLPSTGFFRQSPHVKDSLNRVIGTPAHKTTNRNIKLRRSNRSPAPARLLEVHLAGLVLAFKPNRLAHRSLASSVSLPARSSQKQEGTKVHSLAGRLVRRRKLVPQPG